MIRLYQIVLTRADCDAANRGESPKADAFREGLLDGTVGSRDLYTHVADLDCADLDAAFEVGNIGPEDRVTRHAPMHSVSVGDVLVTDRGEAFSVAPFGFNRLEGWA